MAGILSKFRLSYKQWILLAFFLFGVLWSGRGVYTMYMRYEQSKDEYGQSQAEIEELSRREVELEKNIRHLETERGIESELRTRFNASKEGEELIVIVQGKDMEAAQASDAAVGWWDRVKEWFTSDEEE